MRSSYWVRHVREPVRFADGVRWLGGAGARELLELGPDGVLSAMARECLAAEPGDGQTSRSSESAAGAAGGESAAGDRGDREPVHAVALLRRGRADLGALIGALAEAWTHGVEVSWSALFAGSAARRVRLPTYAFQRRRYWYQAASSSGDAISIGQASTEHPLLGATLTLAEGRGRLFTGRLSLESEPWLKDHAVLGTALLPGTAFVELALHAGGRLGATELAELVLEAPLILPEQGAMALQVSVGEPDESGMRALGIYSRREQATDDGASEAPWTRHASGALAGGDEGTAATATSTPSGRDAELKERARLLAGASWPPAGARAVDVEELYDRLAGQGLEYGVAFQGLQAAWRLGEQILAEVSLAQEPSPGSSPMAFTRRSWMPRCTPARRAWPRRMRGRGQSPLEGSCASRSPGAACGCTRPAPPRCGSRSRRAPRTRSRWCSRMRPAGWWPRSIR